MMFLQVAGGLALLLFGGDVLVRGAVALARRLGVPPLVIGLTIVAFGTSAPELVVSIEAALGGHADIVLGNVVGSNIANVLLIVGAAALVAPIAAAGPALRREGATLAVLTVLFTLLCLLGAVPRVLGGAMVVLLLSYTLWSFRRARRAVAPGAAGGVETVSEVSGAPTSLPPAALITLAGIAGIVVGAHILIEGATAIARLAGLSDAVIGLSLIALGTSLPELATSVVAAWRGHGALAMGNAIGSNLFNMFAITGATALVTTVPVPDQVLGYDLWVMAGVSMLLVAAIYAGGRIGRVTGVLMIGAYAAYIASLVVGLPFAVPTQAG